MDDHARKVIAQVLPVLMGAVTINTLQEDPDGMATLTFIAEGLDIPLDDLLGVGGEDMLKVTCLSFSLIQMVSAILTEVAEMTGRKVEDVLPLFGAVAARRALG